MLLGGGVHHEREEETKWQERSVKQNDCREREQLDGEWRWWWWRRSTAGNEQLWSLAAHRLIPLGNLRIILSFTKWMSLERGPPIKGYAKGKVNSRKERESHIATSFTLLLEFVVYASFLILTSEATQPSQHLIIKKKKKPRRKSALTFNFMLEL